MSPNGNGQKAKSLAITLYIIASALFIVIKDVTVPLIQQAGGGRRSSQTNVEVVERLARLEEGSKRLELIPINVATLTAVTAGLKMSVERLEIKIDEHLGKGR